MANERLSGRILTGAVMLVLAFLLAAWMPPDQLYAGKGGKGKGDGGDPASPPPVNYWLTRVGTFGGAASWGIAINDSGVVVGAATNSLEELRAFYIIPNLDPDGNRIYWFDANGDGTNDLLVDLNSVVTAWTDEAGIPLDDQEAWTAVVASDINQDFGIVGRVEHNETGETRAFFFDPVLSQLVVLPALGIGDHRAVSVNDNGDILASRLEDGWNRMLIYRWGGAAFQGTDLGVTSGGNAEINNAGVIVTRAGYRLTPDGGGTHIVEFFSHLEMFGVNQAGQISGISEGIRVKGKWIQPAGAFRSSQDDPSGTPILEVLTESGVGPRINSAGDVCVRVNGRGFVHTDETGLHALDDSVVNQDVDWVEATWVTQSQMNSRDGTGFGQIVGYTLIAGEENSGFVLTPVAP